MRVIVFCLSGMGNTVLFTPTLRALRKSYPKAHVTLLVAKAVFAEPVNGSGLVDEVLVFSGQSVFGKIGLLWKLRMAKYDYSVTAFPSNRWQHNLFSFLVGARIRITHSYQSARLRTLSFLQNRKVPAVEGIHDVEQNLQLLGTFDSGAISADLDSQPFFHLAQGDKSFAEDFWAKHALKDKLVIGIHAGCDRKSSYKRWPESSFVELTRLVIDERDAWVLLFAGPDEEQHVEEIHRLFVGSDRVHLVKATPLKKVAALIARCDCFICNDSGLGHVAAAVGTRTIAIFGPTMYVRIAPYGEDTAVVRQDTHCSPCSQYPFGATNGRVPCRNHRACLVGLQPATVLEAVDSLRHRSIL